MAEAHPIKRSERFFSALGRPLVAMGRSSRELFVLTSDTARVIVSGRTSRQELFKQAFEIGNRSLVFILITLGVLGLIAVYQVAMQVERILPDFSMVGAAFIHTMVREFAPTITGLMIATRVGSGIAAEIGSMVVTEQVDALQMSHADPVAYLIAPRTLASGLMMVVLSVAGIISATLLGMVIAKMSYDIPVRTFLRFDLVSISDIFVGMSKAIAYGLAIPIIAGQAGLKASGGSAGVGRATTQAVVQTSFAVIVLDFLISGLAFIFRL